MQPDQLFLDFQSALAGRYSLERELGRGGMGVVYLAREVRLDRLVAIKLVPPTRASDAKLRERFLREARTAAKLSHPHIIPIFTVDEVCEFVFFAMAYVAGETLTERVVRRGPLAPSEAARVLREIAWAIRRGTPGATLASGGAGSVTCLASTSAAFPASNGSFPDSAKNPTTPSA